MQSDATGEAVTLEPPFRGYIDNASITIMTDGDVAVGRWRKMWDEKIVLVTPSWSTRLVQIPEHMACVQFAYELSALHVRHEGVLPACKLIATTCESYTRVWVFVYREMLEELLSKLLPTVTRDQYEAYLTHLSTPGQALVIERGRVTTPRQDQ